MKTILNLSVIGLLAIVGITGCIDNKWDLSKVNTGNTVIADTLVAPLGSVLMTATNYLLNGAPGADVGDPVIDQTFFYAMDTNLDQAISNVLTSTDGELTILTTIDNQTNFAFVSECSFVSDEDGTVLLPMYSTGVRQKQTFEFVVTIEEFSRMVAADRLAVHITRTDTGNVTILADDYVKVTLAIRKTGGIKPGSIL